ncbi:MAG: 30S ribosome-binding factor RbfA [Alphaproteobacteria bacterium]
MRKNPAGLPSQRQLRVGEEIRHALASIFMREELHDPALQGVSLTISEVRISPDLKNATVFFLPLGGHDVGPIAQGLGRAAPHLRTLLGHHLRLRALPRLRFVPDESFDHADSIDRLLRRVAPASDDGEAED